MVDENISFQVDGNSSDPHLLRIPPMGLSSAKSSMMEHRFRLDVPTALLCEAAREAWTTYVAQAKSEDEKHGGPDPDDWVAQEGYPQLERVIADQEELELLFGQGGSILQSAMPKILGFDDWPSQNATNAKWYYWDTWTVENTGAFIRWTGTCCTPT